MATEVDKAYLAVVTYDPERTWPYRWDLYCDGHPIDGDSGMWNWSTRIGIRWAKSRHKRRVRHHGSNGNRWEYKV